MEAGSDLIAPIRLGPTRKKLAGCGYTVEEVVAAGIGTAKRAAAGTAARVMLDVSPIGELLEPAGALKFEEAYEIYKGSCPGGLACRSGSGEIRHNDRRMR